MGHLVENVENQLALLSTIDLDEVMETVARILLDAGEAKAVSILMWDEDLESFGETEVFGPKKKEFAKFVEAVSEADSDNLFNGKVSGELDLDEVSAKLPSDLESVIYHKLEDSEGRCGLILIAGVDPEEAAELSEEISFRAGSYWWMRCSGDTRRNADGTPTASPCISFQETP